jgi:hypothetical protein
MELGDVSGHADTRRRPIPADGIGLLHHEAIEGAPHGFGQCSKGIHLSIEIARERGPTDGGRGFRFHRASFLKEINIDVNQFPVYR